MADDYTFGMEEEYFLVDAETKLVARGMPPEFFEAGRKATDDRMRGELLQSQVEVVTRPHVDVASARNELRELRRTVAKIAGEHGLAILAAGTHPTAVWSASKPTVKERYDHVMDELQMLGLRNMVCGLHVHVEHVGLAAYRRLPVYRGERTFQDTRACLRMGWTGRAPAPNRSENELGL